MHVLRVVARTAVALVSAATLVATGVGWSLQRQVTAAIVTSNAVAPAVPVQPGQAFTALLVGLDARTDASGNPLPTATLDALHVGPDDGQLHTDTMILLHVPADPGAPAVAISIPRDSYVPIAGDRGTHKINSAYGRAFDDQQKTLTAQGVTGAALDQQSREAGRAATIATVEALTGVQIDHYAEINFAGFVDLTATLGGVPVCLNQAVSDSYSGIDLPAGPQTVNGTTALAFVRQRHGLDGGDLDRVARQQAFIAGLTTRLRSTGALTDPAKLAQLVDVASRYVVIDSGWDLDQAVAQMARLAGDNLTFYTIPTGRPDLRTPYDGVAVQIDKAAVQEFVGGLVSGVVPTAPPVQIEPAGNPAPTSAAAPTTTAAPTTAPRVISADGVPCVN
ncbi:MULTISPECIES: LCP family protein [unclassified Pseudonocardia]|uniref:LCP family protein n=1 Tax=unclassified Pseudonocardia TaxID=2619320 RepID=UPI000AF8C378|nr:MULTISPECIES: LCP family protein [unclassified Pseudonocardia]MBN9102440.1 LCP family protein [Pseudonocardia sp.]